MSSVTELLSFKKVEFYHQIQMVANNVIKNEFSNKILKELNILIETGQIKRIRLVFSFPKTKIDFYFDLETVRIKARLKKFLI